jgi:methylglyoxal synthase
MINTNRLYLIVQLLRQQLNNPISLTTTGTSGAATLTGTVLNIPNYSSGGGGASQNIIMAITAAY